uniref:Phospholipase-like protein n=1 Tax=Tanacetum cinerariifolium TaxID=118510 RepID=A0A699H619_TANCI|nr:phospholipase-like protein [Tanacetum cinerariifolium]
MYGHYDYGTRHNFGGASSQPNFGGSSYQPNVGGSSSQPNVREQSPVEEVEEIQVPVTQKKPTRRRQTASKKWPQKEKVVDQCCIPWTPEEETALCKGWVRTSEDSVKTYTSGASDLDYHQRELTAYQAEEIPKFMQERQDGMNKRYKSSGSSSFNTKDSGEGSINLNNTVGTEDENEMEEVQEVRRPKPMGRDQAKRKIKGGSASSASSFDVRELAKMMAREYVMASDPYNTQKNQEMSKLLKIKNQELELKAVELEIRRVENRQRDEALYETTTDEALKERLRQRLFVRVNREEFCLVSGLKFGVENSTDYNKAKDPIPFRRMVFSSDLDRRPIRGKDVGLLIESDVFKKLDDNEAVSLCCVGILQLVLLGVEDRRHVPNWILRLANDRVSWDNYPWGSYVWPTLYKHLRDANVKHWQPLYASDPTNKPDTKSYSIEGFA